MTSSRMRSGRCSSAARTPARPPPAAITSMLLHSRAKATTSRMSASSSMIRTRLAGMSFSARGGDHVVEQLHHHALELGGRNRSIGQELGGTERESVALRGCRLASRIDDERNRPQHLMILQPVNDGEAVDIWKREIEDQQIRHYLARHLDCGASGRRVHHLNAVA